MEQKTQVFPAGVRVFDKHANAPEFVLGSVVITLQEFREFVNNNQQYLTKYNGNDQLRLQLLRSKDGKLYTTVDTYKPGEKAAAPTPKAEPQPVDNGSDLPF